MHAVLCTLVANYVYKKKYSGSCLIWCTVNPKLGLGGIKLSPNNLPLHAQTNELSSHDNLVLSCFMLDKNDAKFFVRCFSIIFSGVARNFSGKRWYSHTLNHQPG